jgi:adenine-specific DNA-methyltransferase
MRLALHNRGVTTTGSHVMPELSFKGKEFVHNHHLTVPHRPLVPDPAKGIGPARLDGNLIIQGDNLHALKSLLPLYAGKVDCIFIDPPYNTGNEGWSYNDNVNSPMLQAWLRENPIGIEDGLRHDKWCAMMWPRLTLLHELLGEAGSLWMTLDDNEVHRARLVLDEIFGEQNFVTAICWANKVSPANDALFFSQDHNQILIYAKDAACWMPTRLERTEDQEALYTNVDGDKRGPWNSLAFTSNKNAAERPNLYYPIKHPTTGVDIYPPEGSTWRTSKDKCEELIKDGRLFWGVEGTARQPRLKRFLSEMEGVVPPGPPHSPSILIEPPACAPVLRHPTPPPCA